MNDRKTPWFYNTRHALYRILDRIFVTDVLALALGATLGYIAITSLQDFVRVRGHTPPAKRCCCDIGEPCLCPRGYCDCAEKERR
jgi:hypothetical protein